MFMQMYAQDNVLNLLARTYPPSNGISLTDCKSTHGVFATGLIIV